VRIWDFLDLVLGRGMWRKRDGYIYIIFLSFSFSFSFSLSWFLILVWGEGRGGIYTILSFAENIGNCILGGKWERLAFHCRRGKGGLLGTCSSPTRGDSKRELDGEKTARGIKVTKETKNVRPGQSGEEEI
jgi:hypothetical protein